MLVIVYFQYASFSFLIQTILLMLYPYLPHRICSIIFDVKGLYSRILMTSPPYWPLSLTLFVQSPNYLIFLALVLLVEGSVFILNMLFFHSCSFSSSIWNLDIVWSIRSNFFILCILSAAQIWTLVLHTLPFRVSRHIANNVFQNHSTNYHSIYPYSMY